MSTVFTEITDLAAPRLTPEMHAMCERIGRHDQYSAIQPERLLAEASEHTGLDDFGDDWFRTPLEVLCRALHAEGDLSPLGAVTLRLQLHRLLCARLRVEQLVKEHPEIEQSSEPPIVIAGLPRSGTTFLHNLLAADPGLRALAKEEAEGPPDPGAGDADGTHQRLLDENLPLMKMMIDVDEGSTVEELGLLGLSFSSVLFQIQGAPLPSYGDWFLANDQTPAYRYLARVLRVLHWQRGGGPWVLKTIQHMAQLRPLATAFPGATVVCTHRDPAVVLPSMSTLLAYGQRLITRTVDPVRTAAYWTERVLGMVERCMSDRDHVDERRIVDVPFRRIRDDTDGVIREIYDTAGMSLSPQAKEAMDILRVRRHPHRHGRIRYDPAGLGLDLPRIRERSAGYRERFDVPAEVKGPDVHLGDGLHTSPIGLGTTMSVYRTSEAPVDAAAALATLHAAIDAGVTFVDTADVYGRGSNEEMVGKLLADRRNEVTVATKFGITGDLRASRRRSRGDRAYVHECAEASLARLNTDRIDLYYLHRLDPAVPIEETVAAMAELVAAGKVAHLGLCEVTADELRRAHAVHPIAAVQSEWSVWSRDVEAKVVPAAAGLGVGFVPYSPLGRGFLAGTVAEESLAEDDLRRVLMPRYRDENLSTNLAAVAGIAAVAEQTGATQAQVSLAWLKAKGAAFGLPVVPVVSTRFPARVAENLASVELSLSPAQVATLDRIADTVAGPRSRDTDWISAGRE